MKRILALFVAVLLMLTCAPALAETVDLTDPAEFELMAYFVMDVPDTDPIMQYLSDKFNAKFDLTITNIDNYDDTLNMRIASDDLPDWFRVRNASVFNQLVQDGMLLNVSEYVDKYAFTNIAATFEPENAKALSNDGVFYRVPDTLGNLCRGIYYRLDWLEELGLNPPTNFDELRDVLKAMVEADLDGNGTTGMTSYNLWCLEAVAPCWTGYNTWGQTKDGELRYVYEDSNYKEFLKYWAGLYADKLLDAELFTNSYETCMEKLASGRAGFYIMNMNTTWWSNNKMNLAQYDPEAKLGALMPFPEGQAGSYASTYFGYSADSAFSARADEKTASRMLGIMDYLLSDEGRDLTLYGYEEGVYYDLVDGEKIQKEEVVNTEWGQVQHFMGEIADFGSNDRLARDQEVVDWYKYVSTPELVKSDKLGYFYDERATVASTEINEVVNRYTTAFITGEMDIDQSWDEYIAAMQSAGLEEYKGYIAEYIENAGITLDVALG